ncbi:bifunctional transaldolase/phosoglucose isomerase [Novosphingobium sp. Leaf2]|uniref:bifunctional transaldolase/phosoglucose isomerase n=1 Tax=Novosphingobium sp. Leaf2 TaxID=1735670 RepID=UPI0006F93482|nr:bifunctional transaldolase/phosoglucose isomerase [Novosphingobium sp. Leaf2]KQM13333.1 transaldolase [Novosphingobium sp. Leaf2]
MTSRLAQLRDAGQAPWLDFIDHDLLASGRLAHLIADDGVTGVTSNPSIFQKALADRAVDDGNGTSSAIYEREAIGDIQGAADALRATYDRLEGRDGYVSLEVSPYAANDTEQTISEARRLWAAVDRPNLMVKVPGTPAGVPAIRQLIEDGININVTLLFAVSAYEDVAEAYQAGLEARVAKGEPIEKIASVASFFVSRIDGMIDKAIDERVDGDDKDADRLRAVRGKVAIANAKLAYQSYLRMVQSDRWQALVAKGAKPQRLLWASTGTKDPAYSDTLYVDTLIGPDTVNTMPPKTMDAFRDHGTVAMTLTADVDAAKQVLADADALGLDLPGVTERLLTDGLAQFAEAFDGLLGTVAEGRTKWLGDKLNTMATHLPQPLADAVEARLETARKEGWARQLWAGDATLWTNADESKWLGWLAAGQGQQVDFDELAKLAGDAGDYRDAVLLGMGGSSLGPEVLSLVIGSAAGHPQLHVLDTTDPEQIGAVASKIDAKNTLFIVSSKSGSTMEPELLRAFFYDAAGQQGNNFVAVTDPGSKLEAKAKADGYRQIFPGDPAIGGRYSVLSVFGMVPAAAMGIDVKALFAQTRPMVLACGDDVPPAHNPGLHLGAILGEASVAGRDKLTIVTSKGVAAFGSWLEQLLAESTGKQGKGIVPVDLEPLSTPDVYGDDRVFAHIRLASDVDDGTEAKLAALAEAGHPVVSIEVTTPMQLGQEFFRWEMATATAGAVIGIDPFDQPDVEDAKVATRKLVDAYEQSGALEPEKPVWEDDAVAVFAPKDGDFAGLDLQGILARHLETLKPGSYFGILAYIERDAQDSDAIVRMRAAVRDARGVATVGGFGPRFLHSTGQAYKGGPVTGTFLEITRTPAKDLIIPGHRASFGTVQLAQARGDLDVLADRGQHALRVHLKTDDLGAIDAALASALTL